MEIKTNNSKAQIYISCFEQYQLVPNLGIKTLLDSGYQLFDIEEMKSTGRKKHLLPVLEKILALENLNSDDEKVLNTAKQFGGIDNAYRESSLRFSAENRLFDYIEEELGIPIEKINSPKNQDEQLSIIFSDILNSEKFREIDYSKTLIMPLSFEQHYDFEKIHFSLYNFVDNLNETISSQNLSDIYSIAKKKDLNDITGRIGETQIFIKDSNARKFISKLENMKQYEALRYLQFEDVGSIEKIPEELEHAYNRGIYNKKQLIMRTLGLQFN